MAEFIIPTSNIARLVNLNPYQTLKSLGFSYLQAAVMSRNLGKGLRDNNRPDYKVEEYTSPTFKNNSAFGTPVFGELEMYYRQNGEEKGVYLDCVLYEISQSKNIVKTAIQGRNGTIKEYIGDGDYQINIKGVLASDDPQEYPENSVIQLLNILKFAGALEVKSYLLNQVFAINNIVVEGFKMDRTAGFMNIQTFEINAVSDAPIELRLKQEKQ